MKRRVLCVQWPEGFGMLPRGEDYATVAAEALRLSVWRVGCVALGCRVNATEVRMVIQCDGRHEPQALIDWVRAAAAFAISCYTGYAPEWDAAYHYEWVAADSAGVHIMQCFGDVPAPRVERFSADTTVL